MHNNDNDLMNDALVVITTIQGDFDRRQRVLQMALELLNRLKNGNNHNGPRLVRENGTA